MQRRPRAARWLESLLANDPVIGMRLWEGKLRGSCQQRGEHCISLLPRFCMKSKSNTHTYTHPLLLLHTSVSKPQKLHLRRGVYPEDTSLPPHAEARGGSRSSLTRWVLRSQAPLERAAGGAHGLPQLPARGDSSEHLGDLGLAEGLQELGLWEEAGRAECMCVNGDASPRLPGSWVRGVSSAPSHV